jgi:hypothetical protein
MRYAPLRLATVAQHCLSMHADYRASALHDIENCRLEQWVYEALA